jgi:hypothetical protein
MGFSFSLLRERQADRRFQTVDIAEVNTSFHHTRRSTPDYHGLCPRYFFDHHLGEEHRL